MKTVKELLTLSTQFLSSKKVARPRLVTELLLAQILTCKRIELYTQFDRPLEEEEIGLLRQKIQRASKHEPVEYILGEIEFYGAKLQLTQDALIPRQETEILLDKVCASLDGSGKKVLDLCCGSGCLAIGLKKAHPELSVVGVDLSAAALALAKKNAACNSLEIDWREGDLLAPVAQMRFDLVLCNPPYISQSEYEGLDRAVKDFEPKMALVSGPTGYEFYERLSKEIPAVIHPGAKVFFEIGSGQKERLLSLFSTGPWSVSFIEPDWAGHDRFFCLKMKEISPILGAVNYV